MRVMTTLRVDRTVRHLVVEAPEGATVGELLRRLRLRYAAPVALVEDDGPPMESGLPPTERPLMDGIALSVKGAEPAATQRPGHGLGTSGVPWVVVATGPDAGAAVPLPPGRAVTVGRDPTCELTIQDRGLSRRHLRIRHDRDGVRIEDLDSTNGVRWEQVGTGDVWAPGDRALVGSSSLLLLPRQPAPAYLIERSGSLEVTVWPRVPPEIDPQEFATPDVAARRTVRAPSVWTWSLPLVVALAVAVLLRMPWLLLFGLLGPAMVFGHYLGDRRLARLEHEEARAQHLADETANAAAARAAARDELTRLRHRDAGTAGVITSLLPRPSLSLWECADEPLAVTLGEHRAPSTVHLEGSPVLHEAAPLVHQLDAPLVLVGDPVARDSLARSLLLQLATRHPPDQWSLLVEEAPGPGWDLLAWLPQATAHPSHDPATTVRWGSDLALADDLSTAPRSATRVVVHGWSSAVLQVPGRPDVEFRPATLSLHRARRLARDLAPLRRGLDAQAGTSRQHALPGAGASLADLGPWPIDSGAVREAWRSPSLTVPLGIDGGGQTAWFDLTRDGPHALVAGTTGSGKSELLRTLVLGLAVRSSPADLALLLVDFKGGSSLGDCAELPHVTGLVTDLDPHLAQRVLRSLQAELGRRERVLAQAGVQDARDCPDLPRLVVVIDEFRVLAEEVPEVMAGLVRVAAVGRSLGVHLVLATQRPAGVVSPDLRANVNLRIALRLRDAADSLDVIESPDAAQLPEGRPGLALLRTGAAAPKTIQVARATAPGRPDGAAWAIEEFPDAWAARRHRDRAAAAPDDGHVSDLVAALRSAAEEAALTPPAVWHPPLPDVIEHLPERPRVWAIADRPEQQRRDDLVWSGEHHLALVGSARSGRTVALRSLLARLPPAWVVLLDLGRGLAGTEAARHPGVCAQVEPDDLAHGLRVLDHLDRVVRERQASSEALPPLVVVLDGWDRFVDLFGELERGRGVDIAQRVLREGASVGVIMLVTGDRSLLLGRMATLLPETWALRLNDPADLLMTGLTAHEIPRHQPPGRLVSVRDRIEAQVVLPAAEGLGATERHVSGEVSGAGEGGDAHAEGEASTAADEAALAQAPDGPPPLVCRALPRRWSGRTADGASAWAVGGDDALPLAVPPVPLLVLGPPGSGRTAVLEALDDRRGNPLVRGTDPPGPDELRDALEHPPEHALLLVDDAHLLAGSAVEDVIIDVVSQGLLRLVVSAEIEAGAGAFRGLVPLAARTRTAVILQPSAPSQGALVGVSLPVGDLPVPGRGVLVHRGRCTRIQVAAPASGG